MFDDSEIKRDCRPNIVPVEAIEHTPDAHPIAVIAEAIVQDIRMRRSRPWVANIDQDGLVFVMLDIGQYPEGDAGLVRPFQARPFSGKGE